MGILEVYTNACYAMACIITIDLHKVMLHSGNWTMTLPL